MEYCFSLGSNLGDRLGHLVAGRDGLRKALGLMDMEQSVVYETVPLGVEPIYADRPFLNAIVLGRLDCGVRECLAACMRLEEQAGRNRSCGVNSPRTLDIDIIYAGGLTVSEADLRIPHPRCFERAFVLRPLADLRPDLILPGTVDRVAKLLDDLGQNGKVHPLIQQW